jgi:alpha-1,2-mannosyltransferase
MATGRMRILALAVLGLFLVPLFILLAFFHGPPVDLSVYQLAARMFATGGGLYDPSWGSSLAQPLPYTYPPLWAAIMVPFGWLPWWIATIAWAGINVVALWWVVGMSYSAFLTRNDHVRPFAIAILTVALAVTGPLAGVFWFGQLGIVLMAASLADVVPERTRLPRGMLVGLATAVKVTPGIFIVYWVVTRRWRPALVAVATAAGAWLGAALLRPDLSRRFWTDVVFRTDRVGDASFASNQSIHGWLLRSGSSSTVLWIVLAAIVAVVGFRRAAAAHDANDELAAATLVGITALLISPVSWIHHGVWIVPASGIVLGDGRVTWRRVACVALVCLFVLRLPDWTASGALPVGSWLRPVFENAYLWAYVALLVFLPIRGVREKAYYSPVGSATPS